jgi:hypothetical protein
MPKTTLPKGHPSLLGGGFRYTPAVNTDLAKTFARIRRQQLKEPKREENGNVHALPVRKSG